MWPACDINNRGPQLSYDWLLCKHPRETPWEASKNKKIRDRVDSEGKYGRWKLRSLVPGVRQRKQTVSALGGVKPQTLNFATHIL